MKRSDRISWRSKQSMVRVVCIWYSTHVILADSECLQPSHSSTDELMSRIKNEKMTEMQRQQEQNQVMERKRKQMLQMARKKEEALKDEVKSKIEKDEARRLEQQRELKREHDLRKAERDILMSMKQANLARIKRQQEYQQKETLRKVAESDKKAAEIKKQKAELIGKFDVVDFFVL